MVSAVNAVENVVLNSSTATVLVVDDEQDIRNSLKGILSDEGFLVELARTAEEAFLVLDRQPVSLVLIDIWLPGMHGLEALKLIKKKFAYLPVIVISGHASISTAVKATKMGANDFIEKPLDLEEVIAKVRQGIDFESSFQLKGEGSSGHDPGLGKSVFSMSLTGEAPVLNKEVFRQTALRGENVGQRTIGKSAVTYGQGLHTGSKSGLILEPLPIGSGIHFVGVPSTASVPAHLDFVHSTGFATTVSFEDMQISTIEHLMSALSAYRITNLLVKCNGEVPVMDGSSMRFVEMLEDAGVEEQDGEWFEIAVDKIYEVNNGREFIRIEPADTFIIDYTLEYPEPVGVQQKVFELNSPEDYKREIASARTFGFVDSIGALQRQGLALGGRFDNFVLLGKTGAINSELRFPDELVRHKILDAIGDLSLLGRPLRGKVTARMTGHSDNIELLRQIAEDM